jgi:CheY-like chemotaxis protein
MPKLDIAFIIDDDQMFTFILSRQMKLLGFSETTLVFQNGLEALKYLQLVMDSPDMLPAAILLDLNMPVLDGWQFLDEFTKIKTHKKITVFLMSSSIDQVDHARALTYKEVSRFYIKPITKKNLHEMMNEVIA